MHPEYFHNLSPRIRIGTWTSKEIAEVTTSPGKRFASSNFTKKGNPRVHIQHRFFIFTAWEFSPKPSFAAKSKKQLRMVARLQEATTSQDVDQVAVPHRAFVRKFLKFHPSKDHRFPQGN